MKRILTIFAIVAATLFCLWPVQPAQQLIGIGTVANDGTGDTPRAAMTKVNENFTEVYAIKLAATNGTASGLTLIGATTNSVATADRVAYFDSAKRLTNSAAVSSAELEFLDGVTSALQTQLDARVLKSGDTLTGPLLVTALTNTALTASRVVVSGADQSLTSSAVTTDELGYISGVTSGIQTQIDSKVALSGDTMTGTLTVTGLTNSALTASRAIVSGADKSLASSSVTTTELGYVSGVTSAIQTQLDSKVAKAGDTMTGTLTVTGLTNSALTAARAIVSGADKSLESSAVTTTELGYLSGLTSAAQTQLDARVLKAGDTMTGTLLVTGLTNSALTASRALVSGADKTVVSSAVTTTELGYVSGVTSALQTQIDIKAPKRLHSAQTASSAVTNFVADFAGNFGRTITAAADVNLEMSTNRVDGELKSVVLFVLASGGNRNLTWPADWNIAGTSASPYVVTNATYAIVSLTQKGTNETDVFLALTHAQ